MDALEYQLKKRLLEIEQAVNEQQKLIDTNGEATLKMVDALSELVEEQNKVLQINNRSIIDLRQGVTDTLGLLSDMKDQVKILWRRVDDLERRLALRDEDIADREAQRFTPKGDD